MAGSQNQPPTAATDAVLVSSDEMPKDAQKVEELDFNKLKRPITAEDLLDGMRHMGFQASSIAEAVRIINDMHVSCIVTSAGGVEEDFIKCLGDTYMSSFSERGAELRRKGLNRIGNLIVPNANYCAFEDWVVPILDKMLEEQEETKNSEEPIKWTPSKVIHRLGKEINDERSVSSPKALTIDIVQDIRAINTISVRAKRAGMIILGGGVVKHHIANACLMRNGAEHAVYINTGQEFDGSDAGARPDEAVSWGKIKIGADHVKHDGTDDLSINNTFARRVLTLLALKSTARFYHYDGPCVPISKNHIVKTGPFVHLMEGATLSFVAANTSIPVPRGITLAEAYASLSDADRESVLAQLRAMLQELRKLPAPAGAGVQSCVGGSLRDCRIPHCRPRFGPFDTIQDFHLWLREGLRPEDHPVRAANDQEWEDIKEMVAKQDGPWPAPVFTHGDLNPFNIIVHEKRLVDIIRKVPVVQNDPNWRCRTWVSAVLSSLQKDGKAVGTSQLDWAKIEALAREYVAKKMAAGRYLKAEEMLLPKPTWDMLEEKEIIS
ncbi:Homospermidine synthase (spermidine-specific) [Scedosporium apiospermum]|uniref:deoxyhypusine synthase n=1 Tax=Pseudallescheria apiosperma TaxID=563466 RepID=A0A084G3F3_PSEDA|nr:Homospermidine synthase (spermidine-specific) [Scedosporium apiospermum]KEZ41865.1 Homospermidine synthase (spermidine-specific) [Scedosporium apiospermum]